MNQEEVFSFIDSTFGQNRTLVIPVLLVELLEGDIITALLLAQLIYWSSRTTRDDGYIYKTYKDWEKEIGLSKKQTTRAKNKLESLGLVDTKIKKASGSPTVHYRVEKDRLYKWLVSRDNGKCPKGIIESAQTARSLTESTTESTTLKDLTQTFIPKWDKFREGWKTHFPNKPQPREQSQGSISKFRTRMNDEFFQDNYEKALQRASQSDLCNKSNWFQASWFLNNPGNWEKCLNGNYDNQASPFGKKFGLEVEPTIPPLRTATAEEMVPISKEELERMGVPWKT